MVGAVAGSAMTRGFRPSFHLWMTLLMALFVFGGFGMTYLLPLASGTFPRAPPVVHLHGVIFFLWTALLVLQAVLVNAKNVKLHRSLGTFGIGVAAITAFAGLLITIVGTSASPWTGDNPGLFFLSLVAPPSFAVLFAMAIRAVRTPAVHRNLILLAMLSIIMPGINRFYMMSLGLKGVPFFATYVTMDAILAAILYHERRLTGRISTATWIGAAIILVPQPLLPVVSTSPTFIAFLEYLGSLVYYR
jgi:hypothetical protein